MSFSGHELKSTRTLSKSTKVELRLELKSTRTPSKSTQVELSGLEFKSSGYEWWVSVDFAGTELIDTNDNIKIHVSIDDLNSSPVEHHPSQPKLNGMMILKIHVSIDDLCEHI